jgi:hypothetical protein
MAAAGEVPLEEVFEEDAGAPKRDAGSTGAAGSGGGGAVATPDDAGNAARAPFQGTDDTYPQGSACTARVASRRDTGGASRGALFALVALVAAAARKRRTRR